MNLVPPQDVFGTNGAGLSRRNFLRTFTAAGASLILTRPDLLAQAAAAASAKPGSDELRIALIGIGAQGRVLMDDILKIPNIRFVAVCDIWDYNLTYGQRYLKKAGFDVNAYHDFEDMLSKEKSLDAAIVATPDFWHAPITNTCLQAGLNVYCEKMMSNTIEGARSMVQTMRSTGKLLQIGHQRRSNPRYLVALNRLINEAKIPGRITAVNGQWNRAVSDDLGWPQRYTISTDTLKHYGFDDMHMFRNWRWFKKCGGGPLSDLGAHQIDIFNWFLGTPPTTILAGGGNDYYQNHEWFDNAMVIYEYDRPEGVTRAFYQVQTTTSAGGGYFEQFMGTEGTIRMSEDPKYTAIYREANAPDWEKWLNLHYLAEGKADAPSDDDDSATKVDARETAELAAYTLPVVLNKPPHQPHLENFFGAIRGKNALNCPADEAFRSEVAILKASEAVLAKTMIYLKPEDSIA
jgi:predicted dehydrogenase